MKERCGKWMPRAYEPCARTKGHGGDHKTLKAFENNLALCRERIRLRRSDPAYRDLERLKDRERNSRRSEYLREYAANWYSVPENRNKQAIRDRRRYLQYAIERDNI